MKNEKRRLYQIVDKGSGVIHTDKDNYDPEFELWSMAYTALANRRESVGASDSISTGALLNDVINHPDNDQFNKAARAEMDQEKLDAVRHELAVAISRSEGGKKRVDRKKMWKSLVPNDYYPHERSQKKRFEMFRDGVGEYVAPIDRQTPQKYQEVGKLNVLQQINASLRLSLATMSDLGIGIKNAFRFMRHGI